MTKAEKQKEAAEMLKRLNNIDPSIFPENLFEDETNT
jgi:hypothetical protein